MKIVLYFNNPLLIRLFLCWDTNMRKYDLQFPRKTWSFQPRTYTTYTYRTYTYITYSTYIVTIQSRLNIGDSTLQVSKRSVVYLRYILDDQYRKARLTVSIPRPCSIYKTSSVETLPDAPLAYGHPPRPATEESTTETPICQTQRRRPVKT